MAAQVSACPAHLGGALGAALLALALKRRWVSRAPDSRAVRVTPRGSEELRARFGLSLDAKRATLAP